ncbi:MAG: LysR family transcriptional regulator [Burkholderiales bacterium]|nr:LysR family transcriptional regulator [Burkholderiales bacterium]
MDRFAQMALFVLIAERSSLSKAADELGLSSATASRYLSALEERLGTRLVERTTRRLWLTDAGREYHRRCAKILAELNEADAGAAAVSAHPRGVLRITCSVSFAMLHVAPALPEFHELYPELAIQIIAANRYPNFIEAGIDVAIRTSQHQRDSGITMRRLTQTPLVLAAAPAYLARHGEPRTPDDLHKHRTLAYNLSDEPRLLRLARGREHRAIPIQPILESNEGQVIDIAAVAGLGIICQPRYMIEADLAAGRLVLLLKDWTLPPLAISLAYQSRRLQPAKVRVFTKFLLDRFQKTAKGSAPYATLGRVPANPAA